MIIKLKEKKTGACKVVEVKKLESLSSTAEEAFGIEAPNFYWGIFSSNHLGNRFVMQLFLFLDCDGDFVTITNNTDLLNFIALSKQQTKSATLFIGETPGQITGPSPKQRRKQKRLNGRYVKEKPGQSKKRHSGIGRPCPYCGKMLCDKKTLVYHLNSKTACVYKPASFEPSILDDVLNESRKKAKRLQLRKYNSELPPECSPISSKEAVGTNVTVNLNMPSTSTVPVSTLAVPVSCPVAVPELTVSDYLNKFQNSFKNPLSGSSNRAAATCNRLYKDAKRIISACNFTNVPSLFSNELVDKLQVPFSKKVQPGTKKQHLQAIIEFLEFVINRDEIAVDERQALRVIASLRKAYKDFANGAKKFAVNRRMDISQAIREGQFPTYSEVCTAVNKLESEASLLRNYSLINSIIFVDFGCFKVQSMSMEELSSQKFDTFIAYVAFTLAKRCFIRPGALSQMTIAEFLSPVFAEKDAVLVHVKGNFVVRALFYYFYTLTA